MNSIINQFNRYQSQNQSIIQKALTSASGVGAALIPQSLERIITDTVIRLSPELALMTPVKIAGKLHEYNQLTARPTAGGAVGENATTAATNSKTVRKSVELKVIRRKGKITNFLIDTAQEYIDTAAYEMENHIQAHVWDMISYIMYGNADANAYEFDGLDKHIKTNRFNKARGGEVVTSLSELDTLIDTSNRKGGSRHRRAFGMSPEMLSKFSQLLTNVRLNQGVIGNGITQVDLNGGWRLNAYRDIPIIETTATSPVQQMTPTITLTTGGTTGGHLSDSAYYIQIAPITTQGEQLASTEQLITLSGGGTTQYIKASLSAAHLNPDAVKEVYSYKIYVSQTTGTETLLKIVPANLYDADGTVTYDNGVGVGNELIIDTLTPAADVPTHMQADVPLVATGGINPEIIYLWDLDPIQGLGKLPYTNKAGDQFKGLVTTQQLAQIDDYIQFLIKSYAATTPSFEQTSCWVRGVRRA